MFFCPNKDSLLSISLALGSKGLQPVGDGRIVLMSGTGKRQVVEVAASTAEMGNRTGTTNDRDVLVAGKLEQRWGDWDVPSFNRAGFGSGEPLESGGSCLLAVCFDDYRGNRRRYSNSWLNTTFSKRGRVREQIRSRINLKLWDCSWSVAVARVNQWGLSQNNSKRLDQPQRRGCCVSISLSEALGWSECKISMEQILHFDPTPKATLGLYLSLPPTR